MLKHVFPVTALMLLLSACGGASSGNVGSKLQDAINEELRTSVKYNDIRATEIKLNQKGSDFTGVVTFKQRKTGETETNTVTASLYEDGNTISYEYQPPTSFRQIKQSQYYAGELARAAENY